MNSPWLCCLYIYCSVGDEVQGLSPPDYIPNSRYFFCLYDVRAIWSHPRGGNVWVWAKWWCFPILISLLLSSFSWIRTSTASSLGSSTGSTGSRLMWILSPLLHPCHLMGSSLWMDQGNRPLALSVPFPSPAKRSLLSLQPLRSRLPFSHCIF